MTPEEFETVVERATERAIDNKLGKLYIDRETHFKDHEFIQSLRKWTDEAKGTVLRALIKTFIAVVFFMLLVGFIVWGKEHFAK